MPKQRRRADQRLCIPFIDTYLIQNFKPLAIFCECTARFVSDLVGNPEDRFSSYEADTKFGALGCLNYMIPLFDIHFSFRADTFLCRTWSETRYAAVTKFGF